MSGQSQPGGVNLTAVTDANAADTTGVPHGAPLHAYAEAVIARDTDVINQAREALLPAMGPAAVVDAAGVIGNFQRMNRIADAAGLELDAPMRVLTANLRDELGLETLGAAAHTKPSGGFEKIVARYIGPVLTRILRLVLPKRAAD